MFPSSQVAILSLRQLCRKGTGLKTGLLFFFTQPRMGMLQHNVLAQG